MTRKNTLAIAAAVVGVVLGAAGCDPAGPAAEGRISLAEEVDPSAFTYLELRMIHDPGAGFDPTDGIPTGEESYASSYGLTEIAFPFEYYIGAGLGTTQQPKWLVIAWLSNQEFADGPVSGDWYGLATFKVGECGGTFGGYCDTTKGVDFAIDTQIPEEE